MLLKILIVGIIIGLVFIPILEGLAILEGIVNSGETEQHSYQVWKDNPGRSGREE